MFQFNPFDESTWQYADPNKILIVTDRKCIKHYNLNNDPTYLYESDLKDEFKFFLENHPTNIYDRQFYLQMFLYMYIQQEEKTIHPEYIKTINGIQISKYIYEIIKNYSKVEKETIADCFEKFGSLSQKELQKELYYSKIKHAYTISRIYFAEKKLDNSELDSAFNDYYQRKDIINRKDYFNILEKSIYLQDNPASLFFLKYKKIKMSKNNSL